MENLHEVTVKHGGLIQDEKVRPGLPTNSWTNYPQNLQTDETQEELSGRREYRDIRILTDFRKKEHRNSQTRRWRCDGVGLTSLMKAWMS